MEADEYHPRIFFLAFFLKNIKKYKRFSNVNANKNIFVSKTFYFLFENTSASQMVYKYKHFRF